MRLNGGTRLKLKLEIMLTKLLENKIKINQTFKKGPLESEILGPDPDPDPG